MPSQRTTSTRCGTFLTFQKVNMDARQKSSNFIPKSRRHVHCSIQKLVELSSSTPRLMVNAKIIANEPLRPTMQTYPDSRQAKCQRTATTKIGGTLIRPIPTRPWMTSRPIGKTTSTLSTQRIHLSSIQSTQASLSHLFLVVNSAVASSKLLRALNFKILTIRFVAT